MLRLAPNLQLFSVQTGRGLFEVLRPRARGALTKFFVVGLTKCQEMYPGLNELDDGQRKAFWEILWDMDPHHVTCLMFARKAGAVDFDGILYIYIASTTTDAEKWRRFFREQFLRMCEITWHNRILKDTGGLYQTKMVLIMNERWVAELAWPVVAFRRCQPSTTLGQPKAEARG